MAAAQKVGGLVLGAFDDAGTLIGFTFAFLGRLDGALVLYPQLARSIRTRGPGHRSPAQVRAALILLARRA
jgi:predicted GNAT superfamily acetyltransferase